MHEPSETPTFIITDDPILSESEVRAFLAASYYFGPEAVHLADPPASPAPLLNRCRCGCVISENKRQCLACANK